MTIALLAIGCLVVLTVLSVWFIYSYVLQLPMYVDREIGSKVQVGPDWVEIRPNSPMKIYRMFQSVELSVEGSYTRTSGKGWFLPDGTQLSPQVQITDDEGNWYDLEGGSYGVTSRGYGTDVIDAHLAGFKIQGSRLPPDRTFRAIRMRSDVPFTCRAVIWRNYNLK